MNVKLDSDKSNVKNEIINGDEKIYFSLPIKDTNQNYNFSLSKDDLRIQGWSVQMIQAGYVTKIPTGYSLFVKDKWIIDIEIHKKVILLNPTNGFQLSMDETAYLSRTLDDIKDDPQLIPEKQLKLMPYISPKIDPVRSLTIKIYQQNLTIILNGVQILSENLKLNNKTVNDITGKGLWVVVINPKTSQITLKHLFQTEVFGAFRELIWTLKTIANGRIVIIASFYDGSLNLSKEARDFMQNEGSNWIKSYNFKDIWCWVFLMGGPTLVEELNPMRKIQMKSASPLEIHVPLKQTSKYQKSNYKVCPSWSNNDIWDTRRMFCMVNDGYGRLCNCNNPFIIRDMDDHLTAKYNSSNPTQEIPIIIMAGNRTRYLFRLLESLEGQPGIHTSLMLIFTDGYQELVSQLAFILGIRVIVHKPIGRIQMKISMNLRFGLYNALEIFPNSNRFIILEDDLILSPDFYSYMSQLSPIFELDPSIFCVSGFNHLAYPHTSRDPKKIYRVSGYPAYGWMISRNILIQTIPRWLPHTIEHDWDMFMATYLIIGDREILIPDISRSYHGGTTGIHMKSSNEAERKYLSKTINKNPNIKIMNISGLIKDNYEEEYLSTLKKAQPVEISKNSNITFPPSKNGIYVIYANKKSEGDHVSFRFIGDKLGIWNMDSREHHNYSWRFSFYNYTIFVIGVPISKYSYLIKDGISILEASEAELSKPENYIQTKPKFHVPPFNNIPVGEIMVDIY